MEHLTEHGEGSTMVKKGHRLERRRLAQRYGE